MPRAETEPESAAAQIEMLIPSSRLIDFATEMFPAVISPYGFPIYPARGRILNTPLQAIRISCSWPCLLMLKGLIR